MEVFDTLCPKLSGSISDRTMARTSKGKKSIAVALSGGMDSFYAARALKKGGWDVVGVHLLLPIEHQERNKRLKTLDLLTDELGIQLCFLDLRDYFQEKIIDYFIDSYLNGITPNPCVVCNRLIKFEKLIEWMDEKGIDCLATGHYARVSNSSRGNYSELLKGKDGRKDQSYFLHRLTQAHLSRAVFPLGDITKEEVKIKARGRGLPEAFHSESQEICFIPDNDYRSLIQGKTRKGVSSSGNIVDLEDNVLGTHTGTHAYTIGQRHGLGIASRQPLYVCKIRPETNEIVVAPRQHLYSQSLIAEDFHWIGHKPDVKTIRVQAQIRYRHRPAESTLTILSAGRVRCEFDEPQWAITPGQALVCYEGERVMGGGWITKP
jgi:tRNA-specific 2-thiouridylase